MTASLGVVIPMFNEEAGAAACVAAVADALERIPGETRLIAVDDGSADGTSQVLADLAARHHWLHIERHDANRGYGAALRTGGEAAARLALEWVLFMDSDLTNPPSVIAQFASAAEGPVDYLKASRFTDGGGMRGVPWKRRVLSITANRVARLAAGRGVTDPTNGFRAVRTGVFVEMPLRETDFAIIMEELYWAFRLNLRLGDVPTILGSRDESRRPTSFSYRPSLLWRYGRYTLLIALNRVLRLGSR
jgi:dolichol-phosphate mannosyltransferase